MNTQNNTIPQKLSWPKILLRFGIAYLMANLCMTLFFASIFIWMFSSVCVL